ncbi:MAG TPA: T9SS type A sorting domain-containing protein [Flavobacteriales bacterium]|nr:T9SS type A sorting domain-containing protein [Flavobacteriales bacterium]HIO68719.1 T9SS type A sorting domain-containing protein [Flavobacteriales bacterium]
MNSYSYRLAAFSTSLLIELMCYAQAPNLGLLLAEADASEGYTLFTPGLNTNVYLIDNCGEIVNQWNFSETPGATCYLLEDGTLLRAGTDSLELRDWDNTLLWSYAMNDNGLKQHHDIEPLPNGNILCLLSDNYTKAEIIAAGRDPGNVGAIFILDKLVELQPIGTNDASVVWEWKFIDHFVQDLDSTKLNYDVVEDHPELLDLNFPSAHDNDWTHVNAVDYNASLDQIIISARHLSEVYIIDHSTTTAEAAGHTGGNANMGGDFLWRWGNPQIYRQGGPSNQQLFLQHDCRWVESGYLDADKISVYNNGGDGTGTFSSVHLITPEISGGIYQKQTNTFLPADFEWSWNGAFLGVTMLEGKKCGAYSLPNGNFLICESSRGQASEISKNGDHLWTYKNPVGASFFNQYDTIVLGINTIFRAEKYPGSYPGLVGKDLTPQGIIEDQNSNSDSCATVVLPGIKDIKTKSITMVNPIAGGEIQFNQIVNAASITITDINGKVVFNQSGFNGNSFSVDLRPAVYFLRIQAGEDNGNLKIIIL